MIISKTLISEKSKTLKKIIALGITKVYSGLLPGLVKVGFASCLKCGVVEETTYTRVFKIITRDSNGCMKKKNKNEITKDYKPTKYIKEIEIDVGHFNKQVLAGSYNLLNVFVANFGEIFSKDLHFFADEDAQIKANEVCLAKSGLKKYLRD